eukprot:8418738-Alexandrium_andersonii.AAC.1
MGGPSSPAPWRRPPFAELRGGCSDGGFPRRVARSGPGPSSAACAPPSLRAHCLLLGALCVLCA